MSVVALYAIATTAAYYLLVRAQITRPLWSRYPTWLDSYLICAACSGFLYGLIAGAIGGWWGHQAFFALPGTAWYTPIAVGLGAMIWTPIIANWHVTSLVDLGVGDTRADTSEES